VRSFASTALVLLGLAVASPASAQVFGQFTGAEPVPPDGHLFGGYVHVSGNDAGLLAQLRLSFYPGIDFGFQGGFVRRDLAIGNRTPLRLGVDLKGKIHSSSDRIPVDVALGGALGVEAADDLTVVTVTPTIIGSHTFGGATGGGGTAITPYGRLGFGISKFTLSGTEDTDFSVTIRAGAEFRMAQGLGIVVELQANMNDRINDDVALAGGVNVPF
jgi:hypothetical protein